MTFLSKTLKTKKRSSDEHWTLASVIVAFSGLFAILGFSFRAVTIPSSYGSIPLEIPVVPLAASDPTYHRFEERVSSTINNKTPMVVMTTEAFFFGDLEAFSRNYSDVRDKFILRHVDGEPQLGTLIKTMLHWTDDRKKHENIPSDDVLVLAPTGDIPLPIVMQVVSGLRSQRTFSRVVLASGML